MLDYLIKILPLIPVAGIISFVTWLITLKSTTKMKEQEAESKRLDNVQKEQEITQDSCKLFLDLVAKTRKDILELDTQYREAMNKMRDSWQDAFNAKCIELAELQVKFTKIEGLVCYKSKCQERDQKEPKNENV